MPYASQYIEFVVENEDNNLVNRAHRADLFM